MRRFGCLWFGGIHLGTVTSEGHGVVIVHFTYNCLCKSPRLLTCTWSWKLYHLPSSLRSITDGQDGTSCASVNPAEWQDWVYNPDVIAFMKTHTHAHTDCSCGIYSTCTHSPWKKKVTEERVNLFSLRQVGVSSLFHLPKSSGKEQSSELGGGGGFFLCVHVCLIMAVKT